MEKCGCKADMEAISYVIIKTIQFWIHNNICAISFQRKLPSDTKTVINGKVTNGRFGLSVTAIGDINDDGVNGKLTVNFCLKLVLIINLQ